MRPQMTPRQNAQVLAYTGTSAQATLNASAKVIRICATSNAWVKLGTNPTADKTASIYIPANFPVWIGVDGAEKIAALQDSAGGNLSIVEGVAL